MAVPDVDVPVVGAGPAGLSAAVLLGRLGRLGIDTRSPVRTLPGIGNDEIAPVGHLLDVYFDADLTAYTRGRPYAVWRILNPQTQGALIAPDGSTRWTYNLAFDPERESPADYPAKRCAELIRHAVGAPDLAVRVRSALPSQLGIAIAKRFRSGRVFLVGDAAHRFPPTGGFGMNTGVRDAHNPAWKPAAVLRGQAGEDLLASYEAERVPVARFNAAQSMRNAERMAGTGVLFTEPGAPAAIEDAAGHEPRTGPATAVGHRAARMRAAAPGRARRCGWPTTMAPPT
ncbi:FAD-dependent monooxygenase [Embleya scabrispora]|uniref:FAD-dependent monooxygenase n=1 Tax=Embleya scabrispora TaxID=159449 RepID=UPI0003767B08|nr:FAD-dependent monooxygenase [Embleya scabrispora]MYS82727.1 hypothetical protein [Streptomyces sp. SID5474]